MTVVDRVRQSCCGIHGHDNLLQFAEHRMFLKCVSCGYETPGWELTENPPAPTPARSPQARLVRPQLVGVRRIA
jgi:hypothetical protein